MINFIAMNILFASTENAWGGFFHLIKTELPQHRFSATGGFEISDLKGIDVLIPTMTQITEEIMEKSDRLKLIQQCGAGLEGVDIEAAGRSGIAVANVPTDISGNADSVAELGIYMMIGLSRHANRLQRSFDNRKMGEPQGLALSGKTAGVIGLGGIGRALIRRLKTFDMKIMGIKRSHVEKSRDSLGLDWASGPADLAILLEKSDYVLLCLPCTDESLHLINSSTISRLKPGAFLVNLSRGGLIEHEALEKALADGSIAGVGLDVFWEEPPDPADPIFSHNVIATPHIAGSTDVSINGIVKAVAENIKRLENNQEILNRH